MSYFQYHKTEDCALGYHLLNRYPTVSHWLNQLQETLQSTFISSLVLSWNLLRVNRKKIKVPLLTLLRRWSGRECVILGNLDAGQGGLEGFGTMYPEFLCNSSHLLGSVRYSLGIHPICNHQNMTQLLMPRSAC